MKMANWRGNRFHQRAPLPSVPAFAPAVAGRSLGISAGMAVATGLAMTLAMGPALPAEAFEVQCGAEGGDSFGWAVASGADYDGDGTPDLAIASPCSWVGTSIRAGRVRVYSGKNKSILLSLAGTDPEEKLGSAIDFVPDLDGDGKAELVVGSSTFTAPREGGGSILAAGKVELFSSKGTRLWTVYGPNGNASFGESVSTVPDVTGDGRAEIAVGASGAQVLGLVRGAGYLLSGADGSEVSRSGGDMEGELWGSLVGWAGDINGDGTADWYASTRIATEAEPGIGEGGVTSTTVTSTTTTTLAPRAGRLTVHSGKAPYEALRTYRGPTRVDRLGRAAVPTADMDGDFLNDLWLGSPGAEPLTLDDAGSISLYSATGEEILGITEPTPQQSATFGTSLVVPGSLDGGLIDDVVAGAPFGKVTSKNQAGRVHAFSGEDGSLLWSRSGERALQRLGQSLSSGFDYNGDGVPDVLVGSPGDAPGGKRGAGTASVLSGKDGEDLASFSGRRGRETRFFVAGPDLARRGVVRGFDFRGRRREAEIRPFRSQRSTTLSLTVVNGGRREETENGFKTLLAVGTGRDGSKPEVAVYRANRRRRIVSRFSAGPSGYTAGVHVAAGDFYSEAGDELAVVPANDTGGDVPLRVYWPQFVDPVTGTVTWSLVREFNIFESDDQIAGLDVNAVGVTLAAGDFVSDSFDEIVAAPASGLPAFRIVGRTGTILVAERQAYPFPGQGSQPNSGLSLAVGNLDGNGRDEIVTAPASGQAWVRAWRDDGSPFEFPAGSGSPVSFIVTELGLQFGGGLTVATADVDLDGNAEILVAPGKGTTARILAFEPDGTAVDGWVVHEPFGPLATGGVGLFGLDHFWRR